VDRIVFDGRRAVGVEYRHGGRSHRAFAGEIISCGGAFNSPQLLQLSGVGDAQHLDALGVPLVADVPGVGQNLQDHLEVYIQHRCLQPVSMQPYLANWRKPIIGMQWLFRRGPASTNHFEAGAFLRSNEAQRSPNLMFHFLPVAIRYDGSQPEGGHGYQVHVGPMRSDSRGQVRIRSTDPRTHPAITFNYLSTEQDRREWVEAIRVTRDILGQPAFAPFDGGEISPGPSVESDGEILDWVVCDAETALHPSGTAKMGMDEMAVVDPTTFRVLGVEGLRLVDASLLPSITNGNIYAPTMMVAERAADAILDNTPLAPSAAPVHHGAPPPPGD
jgi:choline dehydrogenase